jgi:putative endonuclease
MDYPRSIGERFKLKSREGFLNTKILGERGERLAEEFLKAKGYSILERNFRIRSGEIDLIALHGDCLCFIEVKTRLSSDVPQEAVSHPKQRKLTQMANYYLKYKFGHVDVRCRFDVVAVQEDSQGRAIIQLFANAFDAV